ncbi:hypothetical protein KSX_85310 [Ktedonospora formicarum]|uniref:Uncharacterized protein n=1 Tax=Ktedonospora formicarum TaxID=2778364 RepID=A0A8J3MY35_9CHLR|nr:hypothetical protein KSX_85310 [Ktedonospora formicarum]
MVVASGVVVTLGVVVAVPVEDELDEDFEVATLFGTIAASFECL